MQEMNCYVYPALATVPVVALTFRGSKAVVHAMHNYFQFTLRCMVCLLQHMKRNSLLQRLWLRARNCGRVDKLFGSINRQLSYLLPLFVEKYLYRQYAFKKGDYKLEQFLQDVITSSLIQTACRVNVWVLNVLRLVFMFAMRSHLFLWRLQICSFPAHGRKSLISLAYLM